jgi:hypothetical protein
MNEVIATAVTIGEFLAQVAVLVLVCGIPLTVFIWTVRMMLSLRTRLNSIEDKLDLLLRSPSTTTDTPAAKSQ